MIKAKTIKTFLRRSAWTSFFLVLVVCALTGALLHSDQGRLWLVEKTVKSVNESGTLQIELVNVRTKSLGHFRIDALRVIQDNTPLVNATKIKLDWSPIQLFRLRLGVKELSMEELTLVLPEAKSSTESTPQSGPPDLDAVMAQLKEIPGFSVKRLAFNRLVVKDVIKQEPMAPPVRIEAEFYHPNRFKYTADLSIAIDGPKPSQFDLQLSLETSGLAQIKAKFSEPRGGALQRDLAFIPADLDLNLDTFLRFKGSKLALDLDALKISLGEDKINLTGDLEADLASKKLTAQALALTVNNSRHKLDGWLNEKSVDLDLSISKFPLSVTRYWQQQIVTGHVSGDLNISGAWETPILDATLSVESEFKSKPLLVDIRAIADTKLIDLKQIKMQLADAKLDISGQVKRPSNAIAMKLAGSGVDSTLLKELGVEGLERMPEFTVSVKSQIKGELTQLDLSGDTQLELKIADDPAGLSANWQVKENRFRIAEGRLTVAGKEHPLSGWYDWGTQDFVADAAVQSLPLSWLALFNIYMPPNFEAVADAKLAAKGSLSNLPKNLQANAALSLAGKYQQLPFQFESDIRLAKEKIEIKQLDLRSDQQKLLAVSGRVDRTEGEIQLFTEDLPTRFLTVAGAPPLQAGTIDADVTLTSNGKVLRMNGLVAYDSTLNGFDENGVSKSFPARWELALATKKSDYQLTWRFIPEITPPAEMMVSMPRAPYERVLEQMTAGETDIEIPLAAGANGTFNLQSLAFLLDAEIHRVGGNLALDLQASGTVKAPELSGNLLIEKGAYENTLTGTSIQQFNCQLDAAQFKFSLTECTAKDSAGGSMALTGFATLPVVDDKGRVDITMTTRQLSLLKRRDIENEVSGELKVVGPFNDIWIKGEIEVSPFNATLNEFSSASIPSIEVERVYSEEQEEAKAVTNAASSRVNLDVTLQADKRAFLRGRGLEAQLKGKIKISGTLQNISYEGDFEIVRGEFEVFGKKFNLEVGRVQIADSAIGLSIRGVYEKDEKKVIAELSGSVDDLKLQLSAVPVMAEDEILAFIIFGKPLQDISAIEAVQLAIAVQSLQGGGGGFDPLTATRKALGVDTLKVETAESDDGYQGVNVGVGKYLSDTVYLEFEHRADPTKPWRGVLQIELTPNLILESSAASGSAIEGAAIKWKKDY